MLRTGSVNRTPWILLISWSRSLSGQQQRDREHLEQGARQRKGGGRDVAVGGLVVDEALELPCGGLRCVLRDPGPRRVHLGARVVAGRQAGLTDQLFGHALEGVAGQVLGHRLVLDGRLLGQLLAHLGDALLAEDDHAEADEVELPLVRGGRFLRRREHVFEQAGVQPHLGPPVHVVEALGQDVGRHRVECGVALQPRVVREPRGPQIDEAVAVLGRRVGRVRWVRAGRLLRLGDGGDACHRRFDGSCEHRARHGHDGNHVPDTHRNAPAPCSQGARPATPTEIRRQPLPRDECFSRPV